MRFTKLSLNAFRETIPLLVITLVTFFQKIKNAAKNAETIYIKQPINPEFSTHL